MTIRRATSARIYQKSCIAVSDGLLQLFLVKGQNRVSDTRALKVSAFELKLQNSSQHQKAAYSSSTVISQLWNTCLGGGNLPTELSTDTSTQVQRTVRKLPAFLSKLVKQ